MSGRKRRTKKEKTSKSPQVRLTEKTKQMIATAYTHRKLDTFQMASLFYGDNHYGRKMAQRRLKQLADAGYLWQGEQASKPSEGRKPYVWGIDRKGVEILPEILQVEPEEIEWSPRENTVSDPFLEHLLMTNRVRIAIELACQNYGVAIENWLDDKTLKSKQAKDYVTIVGPQGGEQKAAIVPDGYFCLKVLQKKKPPLHHFLEADLATVTGQTSKWGRRDWVRKILGYKTYHKTGLYKKRYGARAFRLLTVTTNENRLQTLKRITEETGGGKAFWFTTFDLLTPQTALTEPIWQVARQEENYPLIWWKITD